jgi:hypothetical protein
MEALSAHLNIAFCGGHYFTILMVWYGGPYQAIIIDFCGDLYITIIMVWY